MAAAGEAAKTRGATRESRRNASARGGERQSVSSVTITSQSHPPDERRFQGDLFPRAGRTLASFYLKDASVHYSSIHCYSLHHPLLTLLLCFSPLPPILARHSFKHISVRCGVFHTIPHHAMQYFIFSPWFVSKKNIIYRSIFFVLCPLSSVLYCYWWFGVKKCIMEPVLSV